MCMASLVTMFPSGLWGLGDGAVGDSTTAGEPKWYPRAWLRLPSPAYIGIKGVHLTQLYQKSHTVPTAETARLPWRHAHAPCRDRSRCKQPANRYTWLTHHESKYIIAGIV